VDNFRLELIGFSLAGLGENTGRKGDVFIVWQERHQKGLSGTPHFTRLPDRMEGLTREALRDRLWGWLVGVKSGVVPEEEQKEPPCFIIQKYEWRVNCCRRAKTIPFQFRGASRAVP
jgi:hypothetical protein